MLLVSFVFFVFFSFDLFWFVMVRLPLPLALCVFFCGIVCILSIPFFFSLILCVLSLSWSLYFISSFATFLSNEVGREYVLGSHS